MADAKQPFPELVAYLEENGYSADEITLVLQRVQAYEQRVGLDSVMASIADGSFDITKVIEEALSKGKNP